MTYKPRKEVSSSGLHFRVWLSSGRATCDERGERHQGVEGDSVMIGAVVRNFSLSLARGQAPGRLVMFTIAAFERARTSLMRSTLLSSQSATCHHIVVSSS